MTQAIPGGRHRFEALDSWRGLCALLVAVHHFYLSSQPVLPGASIVSSFFMFVDFFFVLSGFVIAYTYQDKIQTKAKLIEFMIRRFGRVWPLHAVVMLIFIAFFGITRFLPHPANLTPLTHGGTYAIGKIPTILALLNSFGLHSGGWNLPSWSIGAEFYTYILFGLLMLLGARSNLSIALVAAAGFAALLLVSSEYINATANFGFFRCIYGFFLGVLTFRAFATRNLASGGPSPVMGTCLEILTVAAAGIFLYFSTNGFYTANSMSLAAPPVLACVIWVFAAETGAISTVLKTWPAQFLGRLSYSIYINHWLVLSVIGYIFWLHAYSIGGSFYTDVAQWGGIYQIMNFETAGKSYLVLSVYIPMVVIISYFTYKYIELPGQSKAKAIAAHVTQASPAMSTP